LIIVVVVVVVVVTIKLSVYYSAVLSTHMTTLRHVGYLVSKELKKM